MKKQKYLHGFTQKEQDRLLYQARFLEPYVYRDIDFQSAERLLEVGCGVGAQTQILLERFPHLKVDGVDLSTDQLQVAAKILAQKIKTGKVHLHHQDATRLKLQESFDAAFLCWFLEHVPKPLSVLKKVREHLRSGAVIYCTEVFNQTLFMDPYSPNCMNYWFQFNDYQWTIQGHPFVGAQLGNLLKRAGFVDIEVVARPFHFDSREPEKRSQFIDYFFDILLSAEKNLLDTGRVTRTQIRRMKDEVKKVKRSKDAVFFYSFMQARARVP